MGTRLRARGAAASPAEPDDAALAILLLRRAAPVRGAQVQLEPRDAPRRALAITAQQALAHEARDAEVAMHRSSRSVSDAEGGEQQSGDLAPQEGGEKANIPALGDLEELVGDLLELLARNTDSCLSPLESDLSRTLELAVVSALVKAALGGTKRPRQCALGEVRMWLLELAVQPSALSRQLAFALFFDMSVRITVIELAWRVEATGGAGAVEDDSEKRSQTQLFQVLLEMLDKAVVVASSSRESVASRGPEPVGNGDELSWITKAASCVFLFVRTTRGGFCADRLRALDPQVVRFFLRESRSSQLDDELLELLVFAAYAQESGINAPSPAATGKLEAPRPLTRFSLPQAVLERFGGLELLLTHYYNSPSLTTQRLLFMLFFDVACHQQQAQLKSPDAAAAALEAELWCLFQRCDLPNCVASMPTMLTASGTSRTVKKLYALAPPALTQLMSEKQLGQFVSYLRGVSSSLSNTIKVLRDQKKHDAAEALMVKVTHLLSSKRTEDKFQGERWLAELSGAANQLSESVIFTGSDTDLESSLLGVPSHQGGADELEETCCFDEDTSIRLSARTKFWELAKSPTTAHRESFARTLSAFVKRKLWAAQSQPSELAGIAREVNACLCVAVQQQENSERVLTPLLLLAISICKTSVSKQDIRRQEYDRSSARSSEDDDAGFDLSLSSYDSDSLASRFASGAIALDVSLLGTLSPDFFVHALSALERTSHPRGRCPLLLEKLHDSDAGSREWDERVRALLPLVQSCNTRVAVIVSRLVVSALKRSDESKYVMALRELHARAADAGDADSAASRLSAASSFSAVALATSAFVM